MERPPRACTARASDSDLYGAEDRAIDFKGCSLLRAHCGSGDWNSGSAGRGDWEGNASMGGAGRICGFATGSVRGLVQGQIWAICCWSAGSVGKSGAAILGGKAALRGGAGLVTLAVAEPILPIVASAQPEYMTEPLQATASGHNRQRGLYSQAGLREALKGKSVLALGPGLGHASRNTGIYTRRSEYR